jgi:hypothetical protein
MMNVAVVETAAVLGNFLTGLKLGFKVINYEP